MDKNISLQSVALEIYQSILATPKHERKLRSKTFWGRFGIRRRTSYLIDGVKEALKQQGIKAYLNDGILGQEEKDQWIILICDPPVVFPPTSMSANNPIPYPSDDWFNIIESRAFESEREVEYYFITPLLESVGFGEEDIYIGYPVNMFEGVRHVKKEADFVVFNGSSRAREDILLVIEAKSSKKKLTSDADGQAKSYARELAAPYYLVTNATETHLYRNRGGLKTDEQLLNFKCSDLRSHWEMLYGHINKDAIIECKEKIGNLLAQNKI